MHCGHDVLTLQVKAVVAASLTKLLCEPPAAQTLSSDGMAALRRQPPTARQAAAVRDTDQLDGGAITHLFTLIVVPCRAPPQLPYVLKASLSQHSLPPEASQLPRGGNLLRQGKHLQKDRFLDCMKVPHSPFT